jgi:hypothetical protein
LNLLPPPGKHAGGWGGADFNGWRDPIESTEMSVFLLVVLILGVCDYRSVELTNTIRKSIAPFMLKTNSNVAFMDWASVNQFKEFGSKSFHYPD